MCFVQDSLKLVQLFWRRKFLNAINIIFCHYYHPFGLWKGKVLNLKSLESSLTRFSSNWPNGSGEIWKRRQHIFSMLISPPLERGVTIYLNVLKSCLPKNYLCLVWLGLTKWFWKDFLKSSAFMSPLENVVAFHLNKFESSLPGCIVQSLVRFWKEAF